jgi:PEP-CTERM motif
MTPRRLQRSLTCAVLIVMAWSAPVLAVPVVFSAGGSITTTVDNFRGALGNPNNGNAAGQAGGRREINWDGGTATDGTLAVTPFTVFQNTRGATFTTPGSGLTQTPIVGGTVDIAPGVGGVQGSLSALNATYATAFTTFSPSRLFVPLDSNTTDAFFSVPGTNGTAPATVSGFGVVFTDVDLATSASLQFFDTQGNSLGIFNVPVGGTADGSLSFLGVTFTTEQVARVRIVSGNTALGPNDNPASGVDVVAMDDFFYAEPRAVPEPAGLTLMGVGALVLGLLSLRKKPEA